MSGRGRAKALSQRVPRKYFAGAARKFSWVLLARRRGVVPRRTLVNCGRSATIGPRVYTEQRDRNSRGDFLRAQGCRPLSRGIFRLSYGRFLGDDTYRAAPRCGCVCTWATAAAAILPSSFARRHLGAASIDACAEWQPVHPSLEFL